MAKRGKHTGAMVDEFRVAQAANSVMDAISCFPPRDQLREWPKFEAALDHLENALIDLNKSGVDIEPRPSEGGR